MWGIARAAVLAAGLLFTLNAPGVVSREGETVGEIVTAKGDETIRFVGSQTWQALEVGQRLAPGDTVKTGAYGALSIQFQDSSQVRLHRNSTFEIGEVRGSGKSGTSKFRLLTGSAWSRAKSLFRTVSAALPSGQRLLEMSTPTATIGIRGTDWYVSVKDSGETAVTVLSGEVDFFNELGSVEVGSGEQGIAVAGQPPTKRVIVDVRDRPLMVLEFEPRWFEMLLLSDVTTSAAFLAEEKRIETIPSDSRSAADWLKLARAKLDRGDEEQATTALAQAKKGLPAGDANVQLLEGMLLARERDYTRARPLLQRAADALGGRDQVLAQLGLTGLHFQEEKYAQADAMLAELARKNPDSADAQVYRPALAFFAGDQDAALQLATDGERRFPSDARFPAMVSVFHLLRGEEAAMKQAFERALTLDPAQPLALNVQGVYYHEIQPDEDKALAAYRQALTVSDYPELWNNLALVYQDLGDFDAAEEAFKESLRADPDDVLGITNYAMLLILLDRFAEAEAQLKKAESLKPGYSTARVATGILTLANGDPVQATDQLQKAIVANPAEPQAYTMLSFAQYEAERFEEAELSIEQARAADPDDPTPLIVGSIMAQDQAQAGKAIRYARDGLEKIRKIGSFATESITNARSGSSSVGSAYSNLDLDEWGEYYTQLAFSPYDASSHFFLATQYPSARAVQGEAGQGLLLDPTAVSAPNRYYEPIRRPRTDLSIGGALGSEDGAGTDNAFGTLQGFARLPVPVAYGISAARSNNEGFRTNTDSSTETVLMSLGTHFNSLRDHVLVVFGATKAISGLAGDASSPDPDDESELQRYSGSIGWHHRFDYDNRLLARVAAGSTLARATNATPFGQDLDPLAYSFILNFGLDPARALFNNGLRDGAAFLPFFGLTPDTRLLLTTSAINEAICGIFVGFCSGVLANPIPARVDTSPVRQLDIENHEVDLQLRHMLNFGKNIEFTYGAEWSPREQEVRTSALIPTLQSQGFITPDITIFPVGATPFVVFGTQPFSIKDAGPVTGAQAYTQARWKIREDLWTEGGVFVRYYDDETEDQTSVDPRLGLAWEPMRGQWLRAAFQREMGIPTPLNGTLAPVATAGLAISDLLPLGNSEVVNDVQGRWDAEWLPWLYSFVQVEHQDIDSYGQTFPFSIAGFGVGNAQAQQLSAGVNTWFLERFGAFARYLHIWSENNSGDANDGNDLPLLAENSFDLGLTWVHPRQIRASVVGSFVGERWGDVANTLELESYFTVAASVNWQPYHRHWSLTLAASNLFDEDYDLAPGAPAPGTAVSFTAEYRF